MTTHLDPPADDGGRPGAPGVPAAAHRLHRRPDRLRPGQVRERAHRLAAVPRAVDRRHRAGHRAAGDVRRRRRRGAGRRPRRGRTPDRRLGRGRLARRDHREPADDPRASTTSRCATSACSSAPSPSPGWPCSTPRPAGPAPDRDRSRTRRPAPRTGPPSCASSAAADAVDLAAAEQAVAALLRALGRDPVEPAPGRHPAAGGRRLRRAAHPAAVRPHHVPQRRGLQRAGDGHRHPGAVAVRAPPAALRRGRAHRLPARRADPRACRSWPGSSTCSPATSRCRSGSPSRSPTGCRTT